MIKKTTYISENMFIAVIMYNLPALFKEKVLLQCWAFAMEQLWCAFKIKDEIWQSNKMNSESNKS